MGQYYSVFGGLAAMIIGFILIILNFGLFIKAIIVGLFAVLLLGGLIAFIAGISEIKDSAAKVEEEKVEEKVEEKAEEKTE